MTRPPPEQVRAWIRESIERSPGRDAPLAPDEVEALLAGIGQDIVEGRAQLWIGEASAVVTQAVHGVRIWQAGGDMQDIIAQMQRAARVLKAQGFERLTIEATRKGWAKALRPYGFTPLQGLEVEL